MTDNIGKIRLFSLDEKEKSKGYAKIYIGRGCLRGFEFTGLGSPIPAFIEADAKEKRRLYAQYLKKKIETHSQLENVLNRLAQRVASGENIGLFCFTEAQTIHGQVVMDAINWILSGKELDDWTWEDVG